MQLEPSGFRAAARSIAEGLVAEYVADAAPTKVLLSRRMHDEMVRAMNVANSDQYPELLKRARREIYHELERETLRTFTSSELFQQLLHALSFGTDLGDLERELSEFEV